MASNVYTFGKLDEPFCSVTTPLLNPPWACHAIPAHYSLSLSLLSSPILGGFHHNSPTISA